MSPDPAKNLRMAPGMNARTKMATLTIGMMSQKVSSSGQNGSGPKCAVSLG